MSTFTCADCACRASSLATPSLTDALSEENETATILALDALYQLASRNGDASPAVRRHVSYAWTTSKVVPDVEEFPAVKLQLKYFGLA